MTLQAGSRLGNYEILGLLGAGGMGEVYRAADQKLGRQVAIKVLPEEFARDPARVARFEREARMLAAVNHATIAGIYGSEQDGETRYIVMELVEGETLATRLTAGPLPIADALRFGDQVAEALEVAHEKGVIHRDLKPANVKVTPEGRVKVLDFGLAKAMQLPFSGDMSKSPTVAMDASRPGEIFGTPEYMSPEQARGKETDRRTDIWSFGCLLYEMLSGKRAFTGETISDAVAAILQGEPDWEALPARTPGRVRELLHRCLEKDPGQRLRDAGDARLEIEAGLAEMSGARVPAGHHPFGAHWRLAAAVASGVALAIVTYLFLKPKGEAPPPPTSSMRQLAVLPFRNLTGTAEGELMGLAMADTVRARLSNVEGLQVVTPRAAIEASENDTNFARVARKLGADTLLSGSLQREDERYRITYWLIDASGKQLAANALDGSKLFDIQDLLTAGVLRDLRLRPSARRTPTPSGLDTASEQERYLQAIGLLQRYDKKDSVEGAIRILTGLAEEKPNSALVRAALGRADLAMFLFTKDRSWADKAFAAADSAQALDPGLPEVDVTRGETLLTAGRSREAVQAFRRALAARPGDVLALLGLGRAEEAAGDDAAAESAFRRAAELQPSFAVFNQLGGLYYDRGHWDKSAEMYRRATRVAPDSYRALSNLGGVETMRCNFPGAIEAFRKALELQPGHPSAASNLGLTQLWIGAYTEAVASLERASAASPNDYRIWGNLGDAYRGKGLSDLSVKAYERSTSLAREQLRLNPNDAEARSFLATGLARTGHADEAADEMRKTLALDDKDPALLADAAIVAALGGRASESLQWLRKAVVAGYCPAILARQPELAPLRDNPEFRSIIAAPRPAAGS